MMADEQVPSHSQIEWALTGILRRLASGAVPPRAGLGELIATYHRAPNGGHTRYVGEEFGIAQLVGYYYGYDDLEERPNEVTFDGLFGARAVAALNAEVVRLAQAWLVERGA